MEALKGICKAASITIPPNVYVKVDTAQDVEDRLLALLAKHDLSRASTPRDIEAIRKTLQKQRNLDGVCSCWSLTLLLQLCCPYTAWVQG